MSLLLWDIKRGFGTAERAWRDHQWRKRMKPQALGSALVGASISSACLVKSFCLDCLQARAKELKMELLNSQRLAAFFEEHPSDLNLLKHDRPLAATQVRLPRAFSHKLLLRF